MRESRTEIPFPRDEYGRRIALMVIPNERVCEIATKLVVTGRIDQYVQFPRELAPRVGAVLWPEGKEALQAVVLGASSIGGVDSVRIIYERDGPQEALKAALGLINTLVTEAQAALAQLESPAEGRR
ncbi:MAG: hypothetical protein Q8R78_01715 [Candidatus Omnitrophota bacterium]|nr:hypothetical protein [Candidatus Omnitrophota bacterium]